MRTRSRPATGRAVATVAAVVTTHSAPISAQSLCAVFAPMAQRRVSARGGGCTSEAGKNGPFSASTAAHTNEPGVKGTLHCCRWPDQRVSARNAHPMNPIAVCPACTRLRVVVVMNRAGHGLERARGWWGEPHLGEGAPALGRAVLRNEDDLPERLVRFHAPMGFRDVVQTVDAIDHRP